MGMAKYGAEASAAIREALDEFDYPLRCMVKGVNAFPTVLFLQCFDQFGDLHRLRSSLSRRLPSHSRLPNTSISELHGRVPFLNILRFTRLPGQREIDYVEKRRRVAIGTFRISVVEVVITDKLLSSGRTKTISSLTIP
jgi:hypothetical protein